jgi:hypothetical protein
MENSSYTEYLGIDFLVEKDSKYAFKSMGFSTIMGTDDVKLRFVVVAGDIVPTIPYSNIISWVKYGSDFYQYGQSDQIIGGPSGPKVGAIFFWRETQFF